MLEEYEINPTTLAVIPLDENKSMVYEYEDEFIVNKSSMDIVNDSCKFYGSSYLGRFEGTKEIAGYNYKSPIIIEETTKMIFFPTSSPRVLKCSWISLNHIASYKSLGKASLISFKNKKEIIFEISPFILESQILRSTRLWSILQQKAELLKSGKN